MPKVKMYILIKDSISVGYALVAAAHASLATYLKFKDTPEVIDWISGQFYKVICKVTDKEFEEAKTFPDSHIITESALGNVEVAIAFKPRENWPKRFQYYQLYK